MDAESAHFPYPTFLFRPGRAGGVIMKMVEDAKHRQTLIDPWYDSPADFPIDTSVRVTEVHDG